MPEPLAKTSCPMMQEWRILSMKVINTGEKQCILEALGLLEVALKYPASTIFMQQRLVKITSGKI